MESWKKSFLDKLSTIQDSYASSFERSLDEHIQPAFDDLAAFVRDNGFKVAIPLREPGRRSFKFELSENAYTLVIFRFNGIGEFEVRTEAFVPGSEPLLKKTVGRCSDIDDEWARKQFQKSLDTLVEQLAGLSNKAAGGARGPAARPEPAAAAGIPEEEEFVSV